MSAGVELTLATNRNSADAGSRDVGALATKLQALREQVCNHPVFGRLQSVHAVRIFMEHHVWAVWDFMSLLKSIQAEVAPVSQPWKPPADATSARLINEIVVSEEGDDDFDGTPISHFQLYLEAMRAAGASTLPILQFVSRLDVSIPLPTALAESCAPSAAKAFVATTFDIIQQPIHCRVAAFTKGREEIIPEMFRNAIFRMGGPAVSDGRPADLSRFLWYLDRHVSIDGDRHGPMATRLYERVCLCDEPTRAESLAVACRVLERRVALWDEVLSGVDRFGCR